MTTTAVETRMAATNLTTPSVTVEPTTLKTGTMTAATPENPTGEWEGKVKMSQKLPSKADLQKIASLPVLDEKNESRSFQSLLSHEHTPSRTLVVFVRHFFCGVSYIHVTPVLPELNSVRTVKTTSGHCVPPLRPKVCSRSRHPPISLSLVAGNRMSSPSTAIPVAVHSPSMPTPRENSTANSI